MNKTLTHLLAGLLALLVGTTAWAGQTITGTIKNKAGRPIANARVIAWDRDPMSKDDRMGEARTDRRGHYTIRYKDNRWDGLGTGPKMGDSWLPDIYITVDIKVRGKWERIGKSKILSNQPNQANTRISLKLDKKNAWVRRTIIGTIRDRRGRPIANAQVQAWDKDFGQNELMGSAKTDRRGRYRITYSDKRWDGLSFGPSMGTASNPDIYLVVKGRNGHDGKSEVHKDHPAKKTLRINMNID